jgi:hypothetical protein
LHKTPYKDSKRSNVAPGRGGRRGRGQRRRTGGAAGRASGHARPGAHLGAVGCRSWGGGVVGDGFRRWPAAVAAARGNTARKQNVGQQASWGGLRVPKSATRVVGRRRARAESSSSVRRRQWRGKHAVVRGGGASGFYKRLGAPVGDGG